MFQYAAGLALAEAHQTVLKLDVSWFGQGTGREDHTRYSLSCFNITEQFATAEEVHQTRISQLSRQDKLKLNIAQKIGLNNYLERRTPRADQKAVFRHSFDTQFLEQPDNTYLDGLFQSEKYFSSVSDLLRLHFSFRYPAHAEVTELTERILSGPSVAVHFRRGDVVTNPQYRSNMGVLELDYYHRAFDIIRSKLPEATLYIFSDDIEAISKEITPPGPHVFVRENPAWAAHDIIRLISFCNHAIISNSTFAWWGAWLNTTPNKIVITPTPWFADPVKDSRHIVPESWLSIPRRSSGVEG